MIDATAKDGDGAALLAELQEIGLVNGASFGAVASGALPVGDVKSLVGLDDLSLVNEDSLQFDAAPIPQGARACRRRRSARRR